MTDHPINSVFVDGSLNSKATDRAYFKNRIRLRVQSAAEVQSNDYSDALGLELNGIAFERDTGDGTTPHDGTTCLVDIVGTRFKYVPSVGIYISATGLYSNRIVHDSENANFVYLSTNGDGASITDAVLFVKRSAISGDWSNAILLRGATGGDRYEFGNWDNDRPASGEEVVSWLFTTTVTFPAGFLASQAKARIASAGSAVYSIQKNDIQIGTLTFATSTNGAFSLAADTTFIAGDRLSIIAPNPRDASLSGVVITLLGTR